MNKNQQVVLDSLCKIRGRSEDYYPLDVIAEFNTYMWGREEIDEELHEELHEELYDAYHRLSREEEYQVIEKFIKTR